MINTDNYFAVPIIADDQVYKVTSKVIEQQGQTQQYEDLNSNITSPLAAEERQKTSSRREKAREGMKRFRKKQNAELRAYEESLVLARQIEETDDKIDEPTHILQQVISNNNHQQSPVSESPSKEEIKDPLLEIRNSKLTAEEERKKEARREKAREQSKQRQMKKKAELRAYEELCANDRKLHSERANKQQEQMMVSEGKIPNKSQWNTSQIEDDEIKAATHIVQQLSSHQQSPASISAIEERNDPPIDIRTPKLTSEEGKKIARREQDKKQKRQKQIQKTADFRAYEELYAIARKRQFSDRGEQMVHGKIPNELQWNTNQIEVERERLRLESIQRMKDRQRDEAKLLRKEDNEIRRLKRKAEKEEQERERIRAYHELDVESHFLNSLKQYKPIQQKQFFANLPKPM